MTKWFSGYDELKNHSERHMIKLNLHFCPAEWNVLFYQFSMYVHLSLGLFEFMFIIVSSNMQCSGFWLPDILPFHFGVLKCLSLLLIHLDVVHFILIREKWLFLYRGGGCRVEIQWQIIKVWASLPGLSCSIQGITERLPRFQCRTVWHIISWTVPIFKPSVKR